MRLTNLDVVETEQFLTSFFTFKSEALPLNDTFEEVGYESSNFIIELGLIFCIIVFFGFVALVRLCLIKMTQKLCSRVNNCCTRRLNMSTSARVYLVRFLIEGCIELGLVALIALRMVNADRFTYFQDAFSIILAGVTIICLAYAPFYLLYVGRRLLDKPFVLTEREKKSYESLFSDYNLKERRAIRFSAIFFFRRFFMLFVIVFLTEQRNIQIVAQLWTTLFIMSYTAFILPYKSLIQNVQEIFNEWTVLVAAYHLFIFTEWVTDQNRRLEFGWSLIAVVGLNVAFNFAVLANFAIRSCIDRVKTRYKRKKHAKLVAQHREQTSRRRAGTFLKMEMGSIKEEPEHAEQSSASARKQPQGTSAQLISAKAVNAPVSNEVVPMVFENIVSKPSARSLYLNFVSDYE